MNDEIKLSSQEETQLLEKEIASSAEKHRYENFMINNRADNFNVKKSHNEISENEIAKQIASSAAIKDFQEEMLERELATKAMLDEYNKNKNIVDNNNTSNIFNSK